MDVAPSPVPEKLPVQTRDWSLLPLDVLSSVFVRVGAVDVLMGAGLVCHSWLQAAMVPLTHVWRVLDMENHHVSTRTTMICAQWRKRLSTVLMDSFECSPGSGFSPIS
jgi:hypothetical protein